MAEQAARQGFKIEKPVALNHLIEDSATTITSCAPTARFPDDKTSDRLFRRRHRRLSRRRLPTNTGHSGLTITNWLRALHMIQDPVDYLVYRIFVCVIGLVIVDAVRHRRLHLVEEARARKLHVKRRKIAHLDGVRT